MEDHQPSTEDVTHSDAPVVEETRDPNPDLEYRRQRAEQMDGTREVRHFQANDVELREATDGMLRFTGYASVTERAYEVGDFEETIARGAFKRTLSENPDVVLLLNHEGLPLARTKSGTLTLTEDARGLRVDADLNPADPDVQRIRPKLERGDLDEMSFAFRVTNQDWSEDYSQRTIKSVALNKGDVSIVTFGANDASTGSLRSLEARALDEMRAGKTLSAKTRSELEAAKQMIDGLLANSDKEPEEEESGPATEALAAIEGQVAEAERSVESNVVTLVIPDRTSERRARLALLQEGRR